MHTKQAGIGAVAILMLVLVLAGISSLAWFIWQKNHTSNRSTPAGLSANADGTSRTAASTAAVQLPAGWLWYQGSGFRFAYPGAYKEFSVNTSQYQYVPAGTQRTWAMWTSSIPSSPVLPGMSGGFTLIQYDDVSTPVSSKKYGPMVKLVNGRWIITSDLSADTSAGKMQYKTGDVYTGFRVVNTTGIAVYSSVGGDEGGVMYSLFFAEKNHLYNLEFPEFEVGGYPGQTIRDQKPYDQFANQLAGTVMPH